jgi:hypothetical protein
MSQKPISPLRRRMIEDMTVRKFAEKTRNDYIRHVKTFASFLGRSPDTATPEDLRLFQLHQSETGVRPPTINGSVAALRFFFTVTLDRGDMGRHLTFVHEPNKVPVVLSPEEVARLLEVAPGPKYPAHGRSCRHAIIMAASPGSRSACVTMIIRLCAKERTRIGQCQIERTSEHAFANARDVMGFALADGKTLMIGPGLEANRHCLQQKSGKKPAFISQPCPGSDVEHGNHLHVDQRPRRGNFRICQ